MRRALSFTTNERGFILLHVLFVISLLFIIVSYGITSYHNEIYITDRQVEQIKVETVFQMVQYKYKKDLAASENIIELINYEFPDAEATVELLSKDEAYINIAIQIYLDEEDHQNYFLLTHLFMHD